MELFKKTNKPRIQISTPKYTNITKIIQSTPISNRRNKSKNKYHSRFAASIDYFTKLYEKSTSTTKHNNFSKIDLTATNSNKDLSFLSPSPNTSIKYQTNANSPCSLSKKVLYFIDSMTSLQHAIRQKSPNISTLKLNFEREKKNLIKAAKLSLDKKYKHNKSESNLLNYHQTEKKYIGTNININFNKDKDKEKVYKNVIDSMTKEIKRYQNVANSKKYVNRSMQTTPDQNIKPYVRECYSMLKSIYLSIKEKEKQYNNNFNYDKTEYENINYSICYDNENDDNKLFTICIDIKKEIINLIYKLTDNFDRIKTEYNDKIKLFNEESRTYKNEVFELKTALNDYLTSTNTLNTSLYSSTDLIKIFKKSYTNLIKETKQKENEKEDYQKDIKCYKSMNESYKQALKDAQSTIAILEQQNKMYHSLNQDHLDKQILIKQMDLLKSELKEARALQDNKDSTFFEPILNALEKLVMEISLSQKIKDYLYVIFKFIGLSDMEISSIYLSKEKKKKHKMNLFK